MTNVAVLFAREDSIYKKLAGADVWDAERDARKWEGGAPVVAHPPCRAWGRMRQFANPRHDEKDLARFAIQQLRKWGGDSGASGRVHTVGRSDASATWPRSGSVRRLDDGD